MKDENLEWIRRGKTGCVFATILSRKPEQIGWTRIQSPSTHWESQIQSINKDTSIISLTFPGRNKEWVRSWALFCGFYIENVQDDLEGLRYKNEHGISWVQYFGPDSHVKTRQSPHPELLLCVKLSGKQYIKVGFKGILHLAHASVEHIKSGYNNVIWDNCYKRVEKILGHKPTIREAAKTTFEK